MIWIITATALLLSVMSLSIAWAKTARYYAETAKHLGDIALTRCPAALRPSVIRELGSFARPRFIAINLSSSWRRRYLPGMLVSKTAVNHENWRGRS